GMVFMTQRTVDLERGGEIEVLLGRATETSVRVSGKLIQDGAPVAGYMTWLPDGKDAMDRQRLAVANGDRGYALTLGEPGRHVVLAIQQEVRAETVVDVPDRREFTRDIVLPSASLRGVVLTREGQPVAGAKVDLVPRAAHMPRHASSSIMYSRPTDADGKFAFRSLPPAPYPGGRFGADKSRATATSVPDVDLRGDGAREIMVVLDGASGANLRGIVRSGGGAAANAYVFVFDESREALNPLDGIVSDKEGKFE